MNSDKFIEEVLTPALQETMSGGETMTVHGTLEEHGYLTRDKGLVVELDESGKKFMLIVKPL